MTIRQLKYLEVLATNGNLKASAEQLGISAPALSRFLKNLETQLPCPLFIHGRRQFQLTDYGKQSLKIIQELLTVYDNTVSGIHRSAGGYKETLRIGASPREEIIIASIFNDFHRLQPDVEFSIIQCHSLRGKEMLAHGQLDLLLATFSDADLNHFHAYARWDENLVLTLPNFHPYAQNTPPSFVAGHYGPDSRIKGYVNIADFIDSVFVLYDKNTQMRCFIDEFLHEAHFHPSIVYESSSTAVVYDMILSGNGIGFLPAHFIETVPEFTAYRLQGELGIHHGILARKDARLSMAEETAIQLYSLSPKRLAKNETQ